MAITYPVWQILLIEDLIYNILWTLDPHPQIKKMGKKKENYILSANYASDAFKVSFCPQFNNITIRMKKGVLVSLAAKQIPNIASEGIKSQESVFVEGRFVLYYYFLIYQRHTKS